MLSESGGPAVGSAQAPTNAGVGHRAAPHQALDKVADGREPRGLSGRSGHGQGEGTGAGRRRRLDRRARSAVARAAWRAGWWCSTSGPRAASAATGCSTTWPRCSAAGPRTSWSSACTPPSSPTRAATARCGGPSPASASATRCSTTPRWSPGSSTACGAGRRSSWSTRTATSSGPWPVRATGRCCCRRWRTRIGRAGPLPQPAPAPRPPASPAAARQPGVPRQGGQRTGRAAGRRRHRPQPGAGRRPAVDLAAAGPHHPHRLRAAPAPGGPALRPGAVHLRHRQRPAGPHRPRRPARARRGSSSPTAAGIIRLRVRTDDLLAAGPGLALGRDADLDRSLVVAEAGRNRLWRVPADGTAPGIIAGTRYEGLARRPRRRGRAGPALRG